MRTRSRVSKPPEARTAVAERPPREVIPARGLGALLETIPVGRGDWTERDVRPERVVAPLSVSERVVAELGDRGGGPVEIGVSHDPGRTIDALVDEAERGGGRARLDGRRLVMPGIREPTIAADCRSLSEVGDRLSAVLPYRRFRARLEGERLHVQGKVNPWVNLTTGEEVPGNRSCPGPHWHWRDEAAAGYGASSSLGVDASAHPASAAAFTPMETVPTTSSFFAPVDDLDVPPAASAPLLAPSRRGRGRASSPSGRGAVSSGRGRGSSSLGRGRSSSRPATAERTQKRALSPDQSSGDDDRAASARERSKKAKHQRDAVVARYRQASRAAVSAAAASRAKSAPEKRGEKAELLGRFNVAQHAIHTRHKLDGGNAGPMPSSSANPREVFNRLALRSSQEDADRDRQPAAQPMKRERLTLSRDTAARVNLSYPADPTVSERSLLASTAVLLRGAGPSTKYSVMAEREIHPAAGANETHTALTALEQRRSGGRDAVSVAFKMHALRTGALSASAAIDPNLFGTFETPGAQNPKPQQQRQLRIAAGHALTAFSDPHAQVHTADAPSNGAASSFVGVVPGPAPLLSLPAPVSTTAAHSPATSAATHGATTDAATSSVPAVNRLASPAGIQIGRLLATPTRPDLATMRKASRHLDDALARLGRLSPTGEATDDEAYASVMSSATWPSPERRRGDSDDEANDE